jgi:hypothetical protein
VDPEWGGHLQAHVLAEAGYVAGGLDVVVGPGDLPVLPAG